MLWKLASMTPASVSFDTGEIGLLQPGSEAQVKPSESESPDLKAASNAVGVVE